MIGDIAIEVDGIKDAFANDTAPAAELADPGKVRWNGRCDAKPRAA